MSFIESIQQNWTSALLFWIIFLISMLIAHFYQKSRLVYDEVGNITVRPMSKIMQFMWTFFIVVGPALLIGFRQYDVGYDTTNYVIGYLNIESGPSFIDAFDNIIGGSALFYILEYVIFKVSSGNPTVFLISMSLPTLFILVRALDTWISEVSLPQALFVYYAFFGMQLLNQSRQFLALSIVFFALTYLLGRKYIKYYLIIFMATLIHYTAIIGFLFHIINFRHTKIFRIKKWGYYSLLLTSPMLLYPFLIFISKFVDNAYSNYLVDISFKGLGFGLVLNVAPVIIPIVLFKRYLQGDVNSFLTRVALLTFPTRLSGYYSYYLMRMHYYGAVAIVLIIPAIIQNIKNKSLKLFAFYILSILCLLYYLINYMYVNGNNMFPYQSVFFNG